MAYHPIHRFYYCDGVKKKLSDFRLPEASGGVYEVVRIYDGIPLFFEEHLERFYTSASLAGKTVHYSNSQIAGFVRELIRENQIFSGNVLIWLADALMTFFIPHKYPDKKWYETGVPCGILMAERDNPKAKVFQTSVRRKADEMIENQGLFEVLLVDRGGRITEGSRSNVFFVKNDRLFTPKGGDVLSGITRRKIISLAQEMNIELVEADIFLSEISGFQALFLSGTSPKILPVSQLAEMNFNPRNALLRLLQEKYDALIAGYIHARKENPDFKFPE